MRGGGEIVSGRWSTRVELLRPGDVICCDQWSGDERYGWSGTEEYFVFFTLKAPRIESRGSTWASQSGFIEVHTRPYDSIKMSPQEDDVHRVFCIHKDDIVTLKARDAKPRDALVVSQPRVAKRKAKPKKGQMSLFGDE